MLGRLTKLFGVEAGKIADVGDGEIALACSGNKFSASSCDPISRGTYASYPFILCCDNDLFRIDVCKCSGTSLGL
jgi:hypothetical protein